MVDRFPGAITIPRISAGGSPWRTTTPAPLFPVPTMITPRWVSELAVVPQLPPVRPKCWVQPRGYVVAAHRGDPGTTHIAAQTRRSASRHSQCHIEEVPMTGRVRVVDTNGKHWVVR